MSVQRWILALILAVIVSLALSGPAYGKKNSSSSVAPFTAQPATTSLPPAPIQALKTKISTGKEMRKLKGTWNLRLQQRRFEDPFNQRSITEFRLLADLQYYPLEEVYFRLQPKFSYSNGYVQTQEKDEASESKWGVKEASINAQPSPYFQASLGALSQEESHPWLLLYDQAFPSARLTLQTNPENIFVAAVIAESGIPTSSSLSTQTKDFEKTPLFTSASLKLKLQKMAFEGWLQGGVYEFQNLPMTVATKSSFLGNSTQPTSGTDSIFIYEYKGSFASTEIKAHLGKSFALGAGAEWVKNNKAPTSSNQGASSRAFAEIEAGKNLQITPFYEFFRVEPDATVAHYNADWISTNRVGYNGGFSLAYKKTMKMTLSSGERDVVYTSPFQQRERTWHLRLETFDVAI